MTFRIGFYANSILLPYNNYKYSQSIGLFKNNDQFSLIGVEVFDSMLLKIFLINLIRQFPNYLSDPHFAIPYISTHDDTASLIGSSRQSVSILITELHTAGLIVMDHQQM